MSDSLRDRITSEVRSFLKCVPDIERVKYKTVLQMLEQHLNLSKDELTAEKDTIKSIIKEEGLKEYESREANQKKPSFP